MHAYYRFTGLNNEASPARWFSPSGTHIRPNQYPFDDGDYPGDDARLLTGHGEDDDLGAVEWRRWTRFGRRKPRARQSAR